MRFIHTSDWQLGKPFGRFPQEVRTALGEARFDAIDRIGALARERDAVHVVVAGDVFDSTGPADREVVQAVTRMGRAPCTWWLLPGPWTRAMRWCAGHWVWRYPRAAATR